MSKYETRAKELVSTVFEGEDCTWEEESIENDFLKLMLQLAEEVEYSTNVEWIKSMKNSNIYTKERVEELLQKQRELSIDRLFTLGITFCTIKSYEGIEKELKNAKLKID